MLCTRLSPILSRVICSPSTSFASIRPLTRVLPRCSPLLQRLSAPRFSAAAANLVQTRVYSQAIDDDSGKHKVFTIPNILCTIRMGLTPVIGSLVVTEDFFPAFCLFAVASVTDFLDGFIARRFPGQKSLLGSVLDPVSDKFLMGTLFVTTTYVGLLPLPLTVVVLARDVCLVAGGFYKRYETMERPVTLSRFFDPSVTSMQIVPTMVSKVNTALQVAVVTLALVVPIIDTGPTVDNLLTALCWTTATTTVWSGLQYVGGKALKRV